MSTENPSPRPAFEQIARRLPLSDEVTHQLLEWIMRSRLRPGDRLPSERELAEQFGVSRTVIREAVRSLGAKGVIEVRSGSGLRVAAVDASRVSESMRLFLHGSGVLHGREHIAYGKIHEVRQMVEVRVAGVACERATADELAALQAAHADMEQVSGDVEGVAAADVRFHRLIAEMTHNELYGVMLDSISAVLTDIRRVTMQVPGRPSQALAFHQDILDRIVARDAEGARRAMAAHLEDSERMWRSIVEVGESDPEPQPESG